MLYYSCIGPSVWYLWSVSWTIVLMLLYYRPHALQYHHTPRCLGWFWHCSGCTHSGPLSPWHSMTKNGQPSVLTVASFFTTPIRNWRPQCQKQPTTALAQNPISERCATEILGALKEAWRVWSSQQENSFTPTNRTLDVCSNILDRVSYHIQAD